MEKKILTCKICNVSKITVDFNVKHIVCGQCAQMQDPTVKQYFDKLQQKQKQVKLPSVKRPRGWKFMKQFVDSQKNVYIKGVLHPQLKGTLPITIIEVKQKKKKVSNRQKSINQTQFFNKVNQLKNQIMTCYKNKDTKKAHRLQKQLNAYKRENKLSAK